MSISNIFFFFFNKGRWEIQADHPRELDRVEGKLWSLYYLICIIINNKIFSLGRTVTFTEQVYSFRIPTRGEALDIVSLDDGSIFAVTTSPVTLHAIDKEHQKILSIGLYEYFPLQGECNIIFKEYCLYT